MIIKLNGQKVSLEKWDYKATGIYRLYINAAGVYYTHKNNETYSTWGKFGIAKTTIGLFISLFLSLFSPTMLAPAWFWTAQYWVYLACYIYMSIVRSKKLSRNISNILPKYSENGYPLHLASFPSPEYFSSEDLQKMQEKYLDVSFGGSTDFIHTPLKTPVMVEGYPVVGAYVTANLHYSESDEGSWSESLDEVQYFLMLEDGIETRVSDEFFRDTVLNIQHTADGEEYWVPVLTGLKESVIPGAVLDAVTSFTKVSFDEVHNPTGMQEVGEVMRRFEVALSLMERDHKIHQRLA